MRTRLFLFPFFAFCFLLLTPGFAQDIEFHGFLDYRYGARTQTDQFEDDRSLNEIRFQLDSLWYHDLFTAQVKADLLYDDLADNRDRLKLETGRGFLDLRQANILVSPLSWMDAKLGRQILTWGTGDLVFINDLFPKDWQSFFLGRDNEYLKAPSDAVLLSVFPSFASIDVAYSPRFDADRYIAGERISYWNGQATVGRNSVLVTERPDDWFEDDEIAARVYRTVGACELAAYGYYGFWKSPGGTDPATGQWLFPALAVYGGSIRGPVGKAIANLETGYYDSRDDRDGDDPFVNNSEVRFLAGFEQEVAKDLTLGFQYYLETMMDHDDYMRALDEIGADTSAARDQDRHTVALRLTYLLFNQNFVVGCFARYSPSDRDIYLKPAGTYKISDRWQASLGGNLFAGKNPHTFLGQFEDNSNIHASIRCGF